MGVVAEEASGAFATEAANATRAAAINASRVANKVSVLRLLTASESTSSLIIFPSRRLSG